MIHPPTASRLSPGRAYLARIRGRYSRLAAVVDEHGLLGAPEDDRQPPARPVKAPSSFVTHTQYADGMLTVWTTKRDEHGRQIGHVYEDVPYWEVGLVHGPGARKSEVREFTSEEIIVALEKSKSH